MSKEAAWDGADEFQILLYNAKDHHTVEAAIDGATELACDLFNKTRSEASESSLRPKVDIEAIKILNDTIARLQKIVKMAKKDKAILWRLQKGEARG